MFVNNVTQHPSTWVYGLDHFPQANPRKPTSMLVKPVSGINFHVSLKESMLFDKFVSGRFRSESECMQAFDLISKQLGTSNDSEL